MKQSFALIAIIVVVLPLISCNVSETRGLSSRGLLERISSNYNKIKTTKASTEDDLVGNGMRLFIDMGEPWHYFLIRGLLPGNFNFLSII